MLTFFLTAFTLITFGKTAQAAVPSLAPGTYSYQDEFRVEQKLQYTVVYAMTDAGRTELARRQAHGEECWSKGADTWLCKAFGSTDGTSDLVRGRVNAQLHGAVLTLAKPRGEPGLVHNGTDSQEYAVPQAATFAGQTFDTIRLVNAQGFWSIRLGENPMVAQFDLENGSLFAPVEVSVSHGNAAFDVYEVLAAFRE
jgi:hypothetical protein